MELKPGDYIKTPRFLTVKLEAVYNTEADAQKEGYTEPTHFTDPSYVILGKVTSLNHMDFAAAHK